MREKSIHETAYTVSLLSSSPERSRPKEVSDPPESEAAWEAAASPSVLRFRFLARPPATSVPTPGMHQCQARLDLRTPYTHQRLVRSTRHS